MESEVKTSTPKKVVQTARKIPKEVYWGLAAVVGGTILIRTVRNALTSERKQQFEEDTKDIDSLKTNDNSRNPTILVADARAIADFLFQQMKGFGGVNSNEYSAMYNALLKLNGKDLQMVYKAFAIRPRSNITGETTTTGFTKVGLGEELDLFGWFNRELKNTNQLQNMRQLWSKSGLAWGGIENYLYQIGEDLYANQLAINENGWTTSNDGQTNILIPRKGFYLGKVLNRIMLSPSNEFGYRVQDANRSFHPIRLVRQKWTTNKP